MSSPMLRRALWAFGATLVFIGVLAILPLSTPMIDPHPRAPSLPLYTTGELWDGGTLAIQEFPAKGTHIRSVLLELSTYERKKLPGTLIVEMRKLEGERWVLLSRQEIKKSELQHNTFHRVRFKPSLEVRAGQTVSIAVRGTGDRASAVTWWTAPTWNLPGHRLLVNGYVADGTAHFDVQYKPAVGIAGGKLGKLFWRRVTVFLDRGERVLLVLSAFFAIFGLVYFTLWPVREDAYD